MPWTLSHPAAIVPLRRLTPQPLDLAALAVGSMTPDIGYYIGRFDLAHFAHTFPGSFVACLPVGMIMLLVFYFSRNRSASPCPLRIARRPPGLPKDPTGFLRWAGILLSLLLGAWTHNFWDAFTHEHGWLVDRIPALQQSFRLGPTTVQAYFLLQELSTAAGLVILGMAYWPCLRRQRPATVAASPGSERWRYTLLAGPRGDLVCSRAPRGGELRRLHFLARPALLSLDGFPDGDLRSPGGGAPRAPRHECDLCAPLRLGKGAIPAPPRVSGDRKRGRTTNYFALLLTAS